MLEAIMMELVLPPLQQGVKPFRHLAKEHPAIEKASNPSRASFMFARGSRQEILNIFEPLLKVVYLKTCSLLVFFRFLRSSRQVNDILRLIMMNGARLGARTNSFQNDGPVLECPIKPALTGKSG